VFGGSSNTKFHECLCKYSCRLSFSATREEELAVRADAHLMQMRTSSTTAGAVYLEDTGFANLHKTSKTVVGIDQKRHRFRLITDGVRWRN